MKEGQRKKVWQGKGNGTLWSDNSFEFRMPEEGSGWKKNILKKRGDAHLYETTGEKQQSLVAHLKVEKGCEDPAAEMQEQLNKLTASIQRKAPAAPRGKFLLNRDDVVVVHNQTQREVTVRLTINLQTEGEVSAKLFNLISEVNKCFAINQKRLRPAT